MESLGQDMFAETSSAMKRFAQRNAAGIPNCHCALALGADNGRLETHEYLKVHSSSQGSPLLEDMQSQQPGRLPFLFHRVISCAIQGQICWMLLGSISLKPRDVPPKVDYMLVRTTYLSFRGALGAGSTRISV